MSLEKANAYVMKNHRHSRKVLCHCFSIGVQRNDQLCGVAIVGRPVARMLDDGFTVEILRVCTDGTLYACSVLYGRCCRIAREMGYKKIVTYTLESENGASLRASGFTVDARLKARESWSCNSRPRTDTVLTLFGEEKKRDTGPKIRWVRNL